MEDAPPQRRLAAGRVVLHGAGEQLVEAREALRSVDEVDDRLRLRPVDAGRDVDQHEPSHQVGAVRRRARSTVMPAERHADHRRGRGRQLLDGHRRRRRPGSSGRRRRRRASPSAVAGQVDGDDRPARAPGRRCPRCARSARRRGGTPARARVSPHTSALTVRAARQLDRRPPYDRRAARTAARTRRRSRGTTRTRRSRCAPSPPSSPRGSLALALPLIALAAACSGDDGASTPERDGLGDLRDLRRTRHAPPQPRRPRPAARRRCSATRPPTPTARRPRAMPSTSRPTRCPMATRAT